jgi:transposase
MYLRVTKRRNADGSEARYFQLAENQWDAKRGGSVAHVLYNFGRADDAKVEGLRRLAASILRVVPADAQVDRSAAPDVRLRDAWPYGGVYVLEALWRELGIDKMLERVQRQKRIRQPFAAALFAMVANRAYVPGSKLACWEQWIRDEVYLPNAKELELHHLYGAMDFLQENKEELEKEIYFAVADLMNADVDLIFYDTTSLHFEVDEEDAATLRKGKRKYEPLRKRGHSKNGRDDAPQIVIGLAVTRDGLPVRSWVFTGNTNDITTIEQVKADLRGWRLGRCIFVGDAGMNSDANRRTLSLGAGKYILACKMRGGGEVDKLVLTRAGRYHEVKDNLRVKEVFVGDGERRQRYVVCHNPDEETRQQAHRAKVLEELEAELATMQPSKDGRPTKRSMELQTSGRYGRYVRALKDGTLRIDRGAVADAARYDGKWVVTSNDDTLTAEDLALGYKQLLRVEQCWRTMKSGLRTRPVFHYRPWRIHAHVSICVLALLLERIAEIRTRDTWRNILRELHTLKVVEYERAGARVLQTTEPTPAVLDLLKKLRVAPPSRFHAIEQLPEGVADDDGAGHTTADAPPAA